MDQGNLMEREWSIDQGNLMSRETWLKLITLFLKTPELSTLTIDQGNLMSVTARTRTLLEEQRQMIIADYREKVGHHELQAAHADEERRLLQGQLWRQKLEFREARQQSLTEMKELWKFQSSTFDTIARRKLIEDQNTILELSGRVQELQNEINCVNDSKDFQDAESVRSGNSHVTSWPTLFPKHPIPEGLLRPSFVSPRRKEGLPDIWDTPGISGNVFANPHASSTAPYPQELNPWRKIIEEPIHMSTPERVKHQNKIKIWDASLDRQPKIQSSSVEETLQRIMGQTNNDCRFWIFTLTSSLHQQHLLVGR